MDPKNKQIKDKEYYIYNFVDEFESEPDEDESLFDDEDIFKYE